MNKSVVITGASAGIGKALAFEFAARGYHLGMTARRLPLLEEIRTQILAAHPGLRVEVASLDVSREETVGPVLETLFTSMGGADVVVVNAGINGLTKVGKGQFEREKELIQTNLIGAIATVNAATSHFMSRGAGQIVGISSLASLSPMPMQAAYCATKAGFSMYLAAARIELARKNIRVTTILPGFVQTDIVEDMSKFPFVVPAEQAAREIVNHVEKGKAVGVVPGYPWKFVRPFLGMLPDSVWSKL